MSKLPTNPLNCWTPKPRNTVLGNNTSMIEPTEVWTFTPPSLPLVPPVTDMSRLKTWEGILIEWAETLTPERWNSSAPIAENSPSTPSRRPVTAKSIARLKLYSRAISFFSFSSLRLAECPAAWAARFCNFSKVSTSALIAPKRASISLKRLVSVSAIERASRSMVVCKVDNSPSKRPRSSFRALILFMVLILF